MNNAARLVPLPNYLKRELISHSRRVCSLYKDMCRNMEFAEEDFFECRFKQLKIRREFDKNKNIKDMRVAKILYEQTYKDFWYKQANPFYVHGVKPHAFSKGGISETRELESPDYVMDIWWPQEKSTFPYYFAKREQMKDEYVALWRKKMLRVDPNEDAHQPRA